MTWTVTLFNQHAQCGIRAQGRTRRKAFDNAYAKAGKEFLSHGIAGYQVSWLAAFNDAKAHMTRGQYLTHLHNPRGFGVEIRRAS